MTITKDTKLEIPELMEHFDTLFKANKTYNFDDFTSIVTGKKIIMRSPAISKKGLIVEINLCISGTSEHFDALQVEFQNVSSQKSTSMNRFKLTDKKYITEILDSRGYMSTPGYYWSHIKQFYATVPDLKLVVSDVMKYINFIVL
jgi:hypothetical protein